MSTRLGELLVRRGVINANQLDRAMEQVEEEGTALAPTLVKATYCTEIELAACLQKEYRLPLVDPGGLQVVDAWITGLTGCEQSTNQPPVVTITSPGDGAGNSAGNGRTTRNRHRNRTGHRSSNGSSDDAALAACQTPSLGRPVVLLPGTPIRFFDDSDVARRGLQRPEQCRVVCAPGR